MWWSTHVFVCVTFNIHGILKAAGVIVLKVNCMQCQHGVKTPSKQLNMRHKYPYNQERAKKS